MLRFPNCKINLGLRITGKREDGYHALQSIFYPVSFTDALEVVASDEFLFQHYGLPIPGSEAGNLVIKAYQLYKEKYQLPAVKIALYKNIPMGAGLGGGSANAAFALKIFNELFSLSIDEKTMEADAAILGSDCPFFIKNKAAYITGRGEVLEPLDFSLAGKYITIVCPGIHISTAEAFKNISFRRGEESLTHLIQQPIETWRQTITNDFEEYVFKLHPSLKKVKEDLYTAGAAYASMSGSGSALYAISNTELKWQTQPGKYSVFTSILE